MREYVRNAGFYSYNAADETEDPVTRWIGREVKRFLSEAHTHLPFLLRHANAPPDLVETVCNTVNDAGSLNTLPSCCKVSPFLLTYPTTTHSGHMDIELGDDEELDPIEEELEAETQEEPVMMRDAAYWDDFLELIDIIQEPWASPDGDTDAYRRGRALRAFNAGTLIYLGIATPYLIFCHSLSLLPSPHYTGAKICKNQRNLPGAHRSWVEHILMFVVPRQIVELGDPSRRSCDACESLGARFKKVIKHLTCRRVIHKNKDVVSKRHKV